MLDSPTPDRKATVLLLLAIAGCVDAFGLAETGRYFVSFMSGNTTEIGLALGYGDWRGALAPAGLVALFVAGAAAGTIAIEQVRRGAALLLLAEAALLVLAWAGLGTTRPMMGVVVLPVAMGIANIVTARHGAPLVPVTYATGTLVRVGVGLARLGRAPGAGRALAFNLAMWLALLGGATGGALARLRYGAPVLLVLAGVLALLGVAEVAGSFRQRPNSGR